MISGVFAVRCPDCGTEIRMVDAGSGHCPPCRQTYLYRVGHLVAVSAAPVVDLRDRASRTPEPTRAGQSIPTPGRSERS